MKCVKTEEVPPYVGKQEENCYFTNRFWFGQMLNVQVKFKNSNERIFV